jgi:hypothetical protein
MEVKFRQAGDSRQLLQFHLAIQIPAKIVDDLIDSLGVFAIGVGLCVWHGFYRHCVVDIPHLALCVDIQKSLTCLLDYGVPVFTDDALAGEELAHADRCAAGDDSFASPRHGRMSTKPHQVTTPVFPGEILANVLY